MEPAAMKQVDLNKVMVDIENDVPYFVMMDLQRGDPLLEFDILERVRNEIFGVQE